MKFEKQLVRKAGEPDSNKVAWTKEAIVEAMGNMSSWLVKVRANGDQPIGNAIIYLNPEEDGILADVFIDDEHCDYLNSGVDFHFGIGCNANTEDVEYKDGITMIKKCKIYDVSIVEHEHEVIEK